MSEKLKLENIYINNRGLGQSDLVIKFTNEGDDVIGIGFDNVVSWVAMPPRMAIELATELIKFATANLAEHDERED